MFSDFKNTSQFVEDKTKHHNHHHHQQADDADEKNEQKKSSSPNFRNKNSPVAAPNHDENLPRSSSTAFTMLRPSLLGVLGTLRTRSSSSASQKSQAGSPSRKSSPLTKYSIVSSDFDDRDAIYISSHQIEHHPEIFSLEQGFNSIQNQQPHHQQLQSISFAQHYNQQQQQQNFREIELPNIVPQQRQKEGSVKYAADNVAKELSPRSDNLLPSNRSIEEKDDIEMDEEEIAKTTELFRLGMIERKIIDLQLSASKAQRNFVIAMAASGFLLTTIILVLGAISIFSLYEKSANKKVGRRSY